MSRSIELFKEDGKPAGVFCCSECRIVYRSKAEAEACHGERICACGEKITLNYRKVCDKCQSELWRKDAAEKEAEKFEKAKKITEAEYTGELVYCGGKYYESVEYSIDLYLEGQEPEYVWACADRGLQKASVSDITEQILDSAWEDADETDLNGIEELQAAIDAFNKANESIHCWEVDYSTAILVNKEVPHD